MKFKTNAKCGMCSSTILDAVRNRFPDYEWSLDMNTADKVLESHGVPDDAAVAAQVEKTIAESGFKGSWIRQGDTNL